MSVCKSCGACCAYFRVSFNWIETSELNENPVPIVFTKKINEQMLCMAGTDKKEPRCVSLEGNVGESVNCGIYLNRSTSCKELQPREEKCNKARLKYGLSKI